MTKTDHNSKEQLNQFLTFILDGEEYGVPILKVNGIQGWEKSTPIPNSPGYVQGIINLRGEVVPIIDLRKRFGLKTVPYDSHTVVIVVRLEQEDKKRTIGLVVDAVADVYDIKNEQMHNTPDFGGKISNDFVQGLGMINEKLVILLEIDKLIDWKRINGREESIEQAQLDKAAA